MTEDGGQVRDEYVPVLNQELKNPHLVETAVFFQPVDGIALSTAVQAENVGVARTSLEQLMVDAGRGLIPSISKKFTISGVPLVLTDQSYLIIRMVPVFYEPKTTIELGDNATINDYFNVFKANWARMASCCIHQVKSTLSNFGITNISPFFYNYINMLTMNDDIYGNERSSYFTTFCSKEFNETKKLGYVGVDPMARSSFGMEKDYSTTLEIHSPFSIFFNALGFKNKVVANPGGNVQGSKYSMQIEWSENNAIELKIPLKELLPIFNVPVLPLLSTNSANIDIDISFYDPRYLFPLYGALIPPPSLDPSSAQQPNNCCVIDCNTYCYLNLKILSDPVNNPLAKAYMEPFLVTRNLFKARYLDYSVRQTNVVVGRGRETMFNIKINQMFYNMTHMALFFYNGQDPILEEVPPGRNVDENLIKTNMQCVSYLKNARAMAARGFYVLDPQFQVKRLQVALGSSQTPLYSVPLDREQLQRETIDFFQKYGKDKMVGKVMENKMRLSQGDAFYVFDFTHARGNGFFVDADNMVHVSGAIEWVAPKLTADPEYTSLMSNNNVSISIICVIFYTNYFQVLLNEGGSVTVPQV